MSVYGHICVRNEAGRYLEQCLRWNSEAVDAIHIYDDQSDDNSREIAGKYGEVRVRPDGIPAFSEEEGGFREGAWMSMIDVLKPTSDDWIFCFDADEFFSGTQNISLRDVMEYALKFVDDTYNRVPSLSLLVSEVFRRSEFPDLAEYLIRTDGWWDSQWATRLVRYMPENTKFRRRKYACGSVPRHYPPGMKISQFHRSLDPGELSSIEIGITHFGYLEEEDRLDKYARYAGKPGHGPNHVRSIIERPELDSSIIFEKDPLAL